MYGLVNRAVQDFVCTNFGEPVWEAMKVSAKLEGLEFQGMQQYPDCVTFALVTEAAKELNISTDQVLEALGEYWVLYTAKEGYGDLLSMSGSDFVSFLQNLDLLHARIGRAYPALQPPAFQCTDATDHSVLLHYRSERGGLTALVIGLISGLGQMFGVSVNTTVVARKSSAADHDVFHIEFRPTR